MQPLRIFIGYDTKETVAYHVLAHSILRHASGPVSITPLVQPQLRKAGLYTRERGKTESTEFSMTRFLVPYLSDFKGYSLFLDCDMLCQSDVYELLDIAESDDWRAVWCVQHDYTPSTKIKFLGQQQTMYPCKNWSSMMLFHNPTCLALTPEYINTATGLQLHQMKWSYAHHPIRVSPNLSSIGSLPLSWNWLVGEYEPNPNAKLLHYTLGTPCFADYATCEHSDRWWSEYERMIFCANPRRP